MTDPGRVPIVRSDLKKAQGILFSLISVGLLTAAVWRGFVVRGFIERARTADGVVFELSAGGSHPQIRFNKAAGEVVEYSQGGMIFGYQVGDRVKVLYEVQAPRRTACIDTVGALWADPLLLLLLGFAFAFAGWRTILSCRPPGQSISKVQPS